MKIPAEIASDLRYGAIYDVDGWRIGIRPVKRMWFNRASGHFVADCGMCFMWSDGPIGPWHVVPSSTPSERRH